MESNNPSVNLASVPDKTTNDFLSSLTTGKAWLGGYRTESKSWAWSDGSQWTGYENWFDDEPSNDENNDYLMMNHFQHSSWSNEENSALYAYGTLCQYDPEPCDSGWKFSEHTNLCYKFIEVKTSWDNALISCKEAIDNPTANLASIPDLSTNAFLARLTNSDTSYWIGGFKSSGGDWAWSDGTEWNFDNWGPEEPSSGDAESHTIFARGIWSSVVTVDQLFSPLCQYDINEGKTTTTSATTVTPTPTQPHGKMIFIKFLDILHISYMPFRNSNSWWRMGWC